MTNARSMEINSQVIFALNKMVNVNAKRSTRYKSLSDSSRELEMKLFFMQYAVQAETFTATLNKWRHAYGAATHTINKESFLDNTVTQLKMMMGGRGFLLKDCEKMEYNALKIYKVAIALSFLPNSTINDIVMQSRELEKVQYTLKALRENGAHQWQAAFV